MSSFEHRVRSELDNAAAHYVPTDGLAGEVARRIRRHRRARVIQSVVGIAGVVVFAAGLVVLLATDERGDQATTFAGTTAPGEVTPCEFGGHHTRPATESEAGPYLGREESDAMVRAASVDRDARVLCRDGRWLIGPGPGTIEDRYRDDGVVEGRLEFEVRDGVVVAVEVAVGGDG